MRTTEKKCFLCDLPAKSDNLLHLFQSFCLYQLVRRCTNILKDSSLYAKLQNGELIAQDIMYHRVCLNKLYKTASSLQHLMDISRIGKEKLMVLLLLKLFRLLKK